MKTGCTSGKKNFVFTFHSVCTVLYRLNGAFLIVIDCQGLT